MATAVIQQAAIEVTFLTNVAAVVQQSAIEVTFLPRNWVPVQITLRGVKLVKTGGKQELCTEVETCEPIKRAV
jgi:hypothetical protein